MKAAMDREFDSGHCLRWLSKTCWPESTHAPTAIRRQAPVNTGLRTRLLTLLAALPLLLSVPAIAGTFDDVMSMGSKFPKRDKEAQEGHMLVKFKDAVPAALRDAKHANEGNVKVRELKYSGVHQIRISPNQTIEQAIARYRADPNVAYAEPNYVLQAMLTPNEPSFNLLWGMNNSGQTLGTPGVDIKAPLAWDFTTGSATVVVMVIDSGVETTHQDLAANIWVNPGEIAGNGIDDDGNGYIDDVNGLNVLTAGGGPFPRLGGNPSDDFGHGTHVAGTIGAVGNNSLGVVGVNWNVKLLPCKMLDATGNGTIADAVTCLDYARDLKARGVNIVATNNSYGGPGAFSQTMADAIAAQGDILFIAAAGNTSLVGNNNDLLPFYPAGADSPNVISVAATDHNDAIGNFSHYGRRSVHIGAPGVNIWSTLNFNAYTQANGTSMSAPHVAGLAALLKAQNATRDWRSIKNLVLSGGDPKPSMTSTTISGRRLNAFNAVNCTNRALFSVIKTPAAFTVGVASTVSALSINCGAGVGPVTGTSSAGQSFTLLDDGIAPDLAAGDGVFTANWTPMQAFAFIDFASAAGSERIGAVDLSVAAVSGPISVNRGDQVTLNVTVANPSTTAAPTSTLNFYFSNDGIITTADMLLGSFIVPALPGGAQQALSGVVTVPTTLAVGTYFVGAIVDPANTIDEGNEANNALAGNAIAVNNIAVDLSPTAVSGPATANTGAAITLNATVSNLGSAAVGASSVNFYLSSDTLITSTDVLVATAAVPALAGGASAIVSVPTSIPATLPTGTYTIGAIADAGNAIIETNENNNARAGNQITTSTLPVDLTMTAVSGPKSARDGESISLTATVTNLGTTSAPASTIQWYLSVDNIITAADTPLASVATASLAGGSSRSVSATTTVPGSVPAGTYYLGVIADPENLIAETNETNNARTGSALAVSYGADLVMTAVAGPTSGATGQNVTFTGTLKNQGQAAINQSIKVGFYASVKASITTADKLIATTTVASLGAGASVPLTVTAALSTGLLAGTYTIGAVANYDSAVPESNNGNNALAGNTIAVTYGPDLVMTAVAAPAIATRGQTVTVTGTVKNQGVGAFGALSDQDSGKIGATISVGFYLSTNATITANDRRIGTTSLSSVPAGSSIPLTLSALIPANLGPGTYYIGAIADDTGAVRESIEVNNALPGNIVTVK